MFSSPQGGEEGDWNLPPTSEFYMETYHEKYRNGVVWVAKLENANKVSDSNSGPKYDCIPLLTG